MIQADVQPLTTSKWVNESNFFEDDDIYDDMPEGFLDAFWWWNVHKLRRGSKLCAQNQVTSVILLKFKISDESYVHALI